MGMWDKAERSKYALILIVSIAHLLLIFLPSVNLEFAFADAARYFHNRDSSLIDQYFAYQANSLGVPWLASLAYLLFPEPDMTIVIRVLATAGIVFMAVGFLRIAKYLGVEVTLPLLAILLLNPLVWTYSGRATADFLPAAIGVFAVSIGLDDGRRLSRAIAAGCLLGVASILKYHELALAVLLFAILWSKHQDRRSLLTSAGAAGIATVILAAYLVASHEAFGFWVTPERFQKVHGLGTGNFLSNLVAYCGFLVLLAIPFSLYIPNARNYLQRSWQMVLPIVVALFVAGAYGIQDNGEMNLGPLDRWIPKPLVTGGFLLLALAGALPFLAKDHSHSTGHGFRKGLGIAILAIFCVLSLTRPAQRYLLPILPFFLLALPKQAFRQRVLVSTVIAAFVLLNAFIAYSQWCTGTAAEKMVQALEREGLLPVTDPGAIDGHVGNRFRGIDHSSVRFSVVSGISDVAIITTKSELPFARKAFSLVPATTVQR